MLDESLGYDRATAVFPLGFDPDKYWPPVRRIDQAYGDRHLVCSCPPLEAYTDGADEQAP
jgi:glycine dehydrogenase